ncbi:hypothetical protein [Ramlibacter sp. 2FC]|uniref:hypothetical protein n=1 Tax=Ramlibacter sp. 2FC TaxID=2502188 RepID=UPI0010F853EE|nr:hypothetical protein [Ramlibacter sp. 2FC]
MAEIADGAIACIGWGSLIWDPRDLPMLGAWRNDGPLLPVEFARESGAKADKRGDKITLVICADTPRVRTCWTLLDVSDLTTARQRLARREGIAKRWETDIGFWDYGGNAGREATTIAAWAAGNGLAAVVWTNLPCKFDGKDTKPSGEQVVAFLRDLDDDRRPLAEAYVRQAPAQIDTPYRRLIAEQLGWHQRS